MPTVKIKGMRCGHCVASVTEALEKIAGVSGVTVSLEKGEVTYATTAAVSQEEIKSAIKAIGFEAE
ncbi:heavy-metal-associated domain-containing protein [Thiovibrio sp. JS02]